MPRHVDTYDFGNIITLCFVGASLGRKYCIGKDGLLIARAYTHLFKSKSEAVACNALHVCGDVLDVELGSNGVQYVKIVRVYLRNNLSKPLLRFVTGRVDAGKVPQKFRVLYEKMPRFCAFCGVIGHVADERGDGSHDPITTNMVIS
jgi:hypothetical protein